MPKPKTLEEIIDRLRKSPAYAHVDVDRELEKAAVWCDINGRRCTPRFFVNWLNKIDPPLVPVRRDVVKAKPSTETYKCGECFDTGEIQQSVPEDRRKLRGEIEFVPCPSGCPEAKR